MIRKIVGSLFFVLLSLYVSGQENRTISGIGNNLTNTDWGSANSMVLRSTSINYADGFSTPNDAHLPIPREISNKLFDQKDQIFDSYQLSDYVWVFGQFIDHDITLVESDDSEPILLDIPSDDEFFSPSDFIFSSRNKKMDGSGLAPGNPRQYSNHISSFVDGSAIYGSDNERANWLRTFENGKLRVSADNLLPWNTESGLLQDDVDPNAPKMADDTRRLTKYFVAGDVRANENPLLISLHTIFVREHNRICDELTIDHPNWNDERIYQRARKLVGAYIQNILYSEWLPAMGVNLPEYRGYNEAVNPGIMNVFSAAAFRIGHTMINSNLLRMDNEGEEIIEGSIRLKDAYFNPQAVVLSDGIDAYFKGMGTQVMQEMDCKVITDLRNFLFGAPGSGGLDLASINIFRGRDRGLGSYNQIRSDFGLPRIKSFSDFTASAEEAAVLENLYGSVDNIDAWVGMLAERHLNDAIFGELVMIILESQFKNLRDGDRFYFENDPAFTQRERNEIKNVRLYDILMRNTDLTIMQRNLFFAMPHGDIPDGPEIGTTPLSADVFPNPAYDETNVKLFVPEEQLVTFKIFNANGQLMKTVEKLAYAGNNFIPVQLNPAWPRGLYNIYIESGDQYNILKLIKE